MTRKSAVTVNADGQREVKADLLSKAVLLDVTYHQWVNRRKADIKNNGDAAQLDRRARDKAKDRFNLTMKMIESDEYDRITTKINEVRTWILSRCVPSYLVNGIFFVDLRLVQEFEAKIAEFNRWLDTDGVPRLVADYPRAKQQAREDLALAARELGIENPWDESAYPAAADLRAKFGIEHSWVSLGVPTSLPAEVRAAETIKIQQRYADAADEIARGLREGFAAVVSRMVERLASKPNEKRIFRDSLIDNFREFCETLPFRNLTDDRELAAIVEQAQALMQGVAPQDLRDNGRLRRKVAGELTKIQETIDQMVNNAPRRLIDLEDD